MDTSQLGSVAEAYIIARLLELDYLPSKPCREGLAYDLGIDLQGRFIRVQCKMGTMRDGAVSFQTCRHTGGESARYSESEIDVFMCYCQETAEVYCVPVTEATSRSMRLRVEPAKNGQRENVNLADDYLIDDGLRRFVAVETRAA